jgi:hypothetical protein
MNRLNSNSPKTSRRHDDLKKLHKKSGVYILLIGTTLYVGGTSNLRNRLRWWAARFPGAGYKVKLCADFRGEEQRVLEALRARQVRLLNQHNPIRRVRELKPPRLKKPKPVGPGRTPDRIIVVDGVANTLKKWCQLNGIYRGLFYARLRAGWTPAAAVGPHIFRQGPRAKTCRDCVPSNNSRLN